MGHSILSHTSNLHKVLGLTFFSNYSNTLWHSSFYLYKVSVTDHLCFAVVTNTSKQAGHFYFHWHRVTTECSPVTYKTQGLQCMAPRPPHMPQTLPFHCSACWRKSQPPVSTPQRFSIPSIWGVRLAVKLCIDSCFQSWMRPLWRQVTSALSAPKGSAADKRQHTRQWPF